MKSITDFNAGRRHFLRTASALSAAGAATPLAMNLAAIGALSAGSAQAATPANYKALVCVFLYGANDAHNMVTPFDTASYNSYATVRGTLAHPQPNLWPLTPITPLPGGRQIALAPELGALRTLFDANKLAVLANVGPLIQPTDRAQFLAKSVPLPPKLFSHNDQQSIWQSSQPEGAKQGWGGRIGDILASQNVNSMFTCTSVTGTQAFLAGQVVRQYQVDATIGAIPVAGIYGAPAPFNLPPGILYSSAAASAALNNILTRNRTHLFENDLRGINQRSLDGYVNVSAALAAAPANVAPFNAFPANNSLAAQLQMVARLISVASQLNVTRQVFMVSLGGFDTHGAQAAAHPVLMTQLSAALAAFQAAMDQLNLGPQVTTFTASDFGRTLVPNGDGTDHGWGGHHFVMGGAVNGRQIYGTYPDLVLGNSTDSGNGRLIPTTSVEQYAATLARWMGVSDANLPVILPNLPNFASNNLGFMA
jgi:uncharacterized protein (DUF1501 family)